MWRPGAARIPRTFLEAISAPPPVHKASPVDATSLDAHLSNFLTTTQLLKGRTDRDPSGSEGAARDMRAVPGRRTPLDLGPYVFGEAMLKVVREVGQVDVQECGVYGAGLVDRRVRGDGLQEGSGRGRARARPGCAWRTAWGASRRGRSWRSLALPGLQSPCGLLGRSGLAVVRLRVGGGRLGSLSA